MKNKYEFKIEDINTVKIVSSTSDNYTMTYTRKNNQLFVITYSAFPDECIGNKHKIKAVCEKCDSWIVFDKEEFYSDNFEFICSNCYGLHEDTISEEELIKTILSLFDEETFFDIEIYINHIKIV